MQRPHKENDFSQAVSKVSALPNISTLQSWLDKFERLWAARKDAEIRTMAERLFNQLKHNILGLSLFLMENSQDHFRKKTDSWTKIVFKKFQELRDALPKHEKDQFNACLTQNMQQRALYLATCGHYNILSVICSLFQLDTNDNKHLADYLNVMISRKQYKEVCRCITQLNLQPYFTIHQVIVPLVLQDKLNLVEAYCKNYKNLQIELLQYLDQFCVQSFDINAAIDDLNVPCVKKDKLHPRAMRKLVARLLTMYNLESDLCPNYDKTKNMGALKYLLYKRYNEPASCSSNWEEFVEQAVGTSHILQDELIMQFICYDDLQAAVKWTKKLDVSRERMPQQVIDAIDEAQISTEEEDWDASYTTEEAVARSVVEYYQLSLPQERIIVVEHEYMLEGCIQQLTKANTIIGIDMEWKPSFLSSKSCVSVVQLACQSHIYIIDMLALATNPDCLVWLMEDVLCNEDILKLGYGIRNDLQMLVKSYPFLADCVHQMTRMIDLSVLQSKMEAMKPDILGDLSPGSIERGLSGLVHRCFGQTLDKKEQMSNWENRPLSHSQIVYGALDAYCLLEIFEYMKLKAEQAELYIDFESVAAMNTPKKVKAKRSRRNREKEKAVNAVSMLANMSLSSDDHKDPISPGDLAVVCDTMLQGLGKQLRSCGVDVKILENDQDHYRAVQIARSEGRIILTRGTPYISLRSQVGDSHCYLVRSLKAYDQLAEVLDFYNVHVTPKDIFSRCQACNGNCYAKVPSAKMREAFEKKNVNQHKHSLLHGPAEMGSYSDPYGFDDDGDYDDDEFFFDTDVVTTHDVYTDREIHIEDRKLNTLQLETSELCENSLPSTASHMSYKEGVVFSKDGINLHDLTVGDGVEVQMGVIQESILSNVDIFYICTTCGKVYWEGLHFSNVLEQYSHILYKEEINDDRQGEEILSACQQN